jgi:hypothetical protein
MTEKDFVMAWLLAFRAGTNVAWIDNGLVNQTVEQAQQIYKQLEEGYHDTDNGVSDL